VALIDHGAMERSVEIRPMRRQQSCDLQYWLSRPMAERIATVELLRLQMSEVAGSERVEQRLQKVCRVAQRQGR
jgi:hypothetical protein